MKIVVLDGYTLNPGDLSWEWLHELGEVVVYDRTPVKKVTKRIGDAEIILCNKVPVRRDNIDASPNLKYIGVLATGYNVIDIEAAKEKGIIVTNISTYGTDSVGQFAIALLLEICHHIGHHSAEVQKGRWETNPDWCFWDYPLIELAGKTMGIIGYGRIGKTTARIAQALGMKVLFNNSSGKKDDLDTDIIKYASLEELYKCSDVISLHCPLFPSTEGMINKNSIAKMKDGVIIINNSRGQLIVEEDLKDALNSGKVYAAGIDVVSSEPIKADNPLLSAKNCIITPHISWAPKESRVRLMNLVEETLKAYLDGEPINVVNK